MESAKPLDWKNTPQPGLHEAETPIGVYRLKDLPLGWAVSFHETGLGFHNVSDMPGVTLEQAKLLAQKDFEGRVRAVFAKPWPPIE